MVCSAGSLAGSIIIVTLVDTLIAILGALEVGDCQGVLRGIGRYSIGANAGVNQAGL